MTLEALANDAAEASTEAPETAPESTESAPPARGYRAALALAKAQQEREETPATEAPAEEAPESAEPEEATSPYAELEQTLLARQKSRQERQVASAPSHELTAALERIAQLEARPQTAPGPDLAELFKADPMAALAKIGVDPKAHAKTVYQGILNPETSAVERQVAELRAQLEAQKPQPPQDLDQRMDQRIAAQADTRGRESAFCEQASASLGDGGDPRFPLVARLASGDRAGLLRRGWAKAKDFNEQGIEGVTDPELLMTIERDLAREYEALVGEKPPHLRAAPGGTKRVRASGAASSGITNEVSATGSARQARTRDERRQAAIELFEKADRR